MSAEKLIKSDTSDFSKNLHKSFSWFCDVFGGYVTEAFGEFFESNFNIKLLSISQDNNSFALGEDFFVTQINLDKNNKAVLKISQDTAQMLLNKALGNSEEDFNIENLTSLEAKILTSLNDYVFKKISELLINVENISKKELRSTQITNFTFFIQNDEFENIKYLISIPTVFLSPKHIEPVDNFKIDEFKDTKTCVNIIAGYTKISLSDLKCIMSEDIIVLEKSRIDLLTLESKHLNKSFKVNPDPTLILDIGENEEEGEKMENGPENLWDNIQVEVQARFEKVKISLGELKQISQGLVIDMGSIFDNKIDLTVENKKIASGELVIINDRYGVKVNEVYAQQNEEITQEQEVEEDFDIVETPQTTETEENFDYGDFDLDNEEI